MGYLKIQLLTISFSIKYVEASKSKSKGEKRKKGEKGDRKKAKIFDSSKGSFILPSLHISLLLPYLTYTYVPCYHLLKIKIVLPLKPRGLKVQIQMEVLVK